MRWSVTEGDAQVLAAIKARMSKRADVGIMLAARECGMTMTAYAQRLNRLIDDPAAMAAEPVVCRILRGRRSAAMRQRARS